MRTLRTYWPRSDAFEIAREPVISVCETPQCIAADKVTRVFGNSANFFGFRPVLFGLTGKLPCNMAAECSSAPLTRLTPVAPRPKF